MLYRSTRSRAAPVPASRAVLSGLAPDGGLYVPLSLPPLPERLLDPARAIPYAELAFEILAPFFPEFPRARLREALERSAALFDDPEVAPVRWAGGRPVLELFHGPTLAFKDLALTVFGSLLGLAREAEGLRERLLVLVATSGDTGKAALSGLAGAPGVEVAVFYPREGVSAVQRLQMATHDSPNAAVWALRGDFDAAQAGVKALFASPEARVAFAGAGLLPSSANSINVGRLLPQVVYYVAAWRSLRASGRLREGEALDVVVPTGNFGDVLAGHWARRMGLPLGRLVVASNANRVLADFFATGTYDRNRAFLRTESPSMDILVSSNLERLLFEAAGEDPGRVAALMAGLAREGRFSLSGTERAAIAAGEGAAGVAPALARAPAVGAAAGGPATEAPRGGFLAGWASDEEAAAETARTFRGTGYLLDPHGAVAAAAGRRLAEAGMVSPNALILETASPFKFPAAVARAVGLGGADGAAAGGGAGTRAPAGAAGAGSAPRAAGPAAQGGEDEAASELALAARLAERAGLALPRAVAELGAKPLLHRDEVEPDGLLSALLARFGGRR